MMKERRHQKRGEQVSSKGHKILQLPPSDIKSNSNQVGMSDHKSVAEVLMRFIEAVDGVALRKRSEIETDLGQIWDRFGTDLGQIWDNDFSFCRFGK